MLKYIKGKPSTTTCQRLMARANHMAVGEPWSPDDSENNMAEINDENAARVKFMFPALFG